MGVPTTMGQMFQSTKVYSSGGFQYTRVIRKIVPGSFKAEYNGADITGYCVVDENTGEFMFGPSDPSGFNGTGTLKIGFEFDVPVRFNTDSIDINVEQFNAGSIPQVRVIEVRVPSTSSEMLVSYGDLLAYIELMGLYSYFQLNEELEPSIETVYPGIL